MSFVSGSGEVRHRRHLEVLRVALEDMGRRARPFRDRDVVGEVGDFGLGRAPVGVENEGKAERLRRLHRPQRSARRGREHQVFRVDLLDGVGQLQAGRRRAVRPGRIDRPSDEIGRRKGTGGVVNEHEVGLSRDKRLEPGPDALLPARAADRGRPERGPRLRRQARERVVVERAVVGVDHDRRRGESPGREERLERVGDQRPAGAGPILLRPLGAESDAAAGRDDDKGDGRRRQGVRLR